MFGLFGDFVKKKSEKMYVVPSLNQKATTKPMQTVMETELMR